MGTYLNKDAAVGDSQHVELLMRVSWLSLRQIVASMGPGTYGTKLILSQRDIVGKGVVLDSLTTYLHASDQ